VNHEPTRWSRASRPTDPTDPTDPTQGGTWHGAPTPQQMHLVSQGYPLRIRRAAVAGALALALAVGASLAASLTGAGSAPTSEQSDAVVGTSVGTSS
jgi:hypothetical protein